MAFFPEPGPVPTSFEAWETALLVISHIGLIPLIPFLYVIALSYLASLALAVFIFSDVYHLCLGDVMCFGLSLVDARRLDHVTSLSAVIGVFIAGCLMATSVRAASVTLRTLLPYAIFYAVLAYSFQTQSVVITVAVFLLAFADHFVRVGQLRVPDLSHLDPFPLALGFGTAILALCLFTAGSSLGYAVPHSIWHVVITISYYFMALGISHKKGDRPFWVTRCLRHLTRDAEDDYEVFPK